MNLPFVIRTIRGMVRDTFRQSLYTKLFYVMLAMTLLCTMVCGSIEIHGDMKPVGTQAYEPPLYIPKQEAERLGEKKVKEDGIRVATGEVSLGFGMIKFNLGKSREDAVRHVQIWMASLLADTVGVLLALLWTAGFLPTFLEPQAATVLLAKPASRWSILLGKYLGVLMFVGLQAMLFILGTWSALGFRTGIWNGGYWLAVPMLIMNFAVFYSVSAFLAVWTRSTVACVFGTLLFWILCWVVNFMHLKLAVTPLEAMTPFSQMIFDVTYWVLPKPLDFGGLFYDAMRAEGFSAPIPELQKAQEKGLLKTELSLLSSGLFALVTLGLSAYEFETTDY